MRQEIVIECTDCGGTGVYHGFAEPEGEAVVCLGCSGTGGSTLRYTPFTARKNRNGIRTVRWSRGSFIATGVGGAGNSISYSEFKAGKFPPK